MINRKYKDRLFRLIFEDKKKLLCLFNAVNGTTYINEKDIQITTIEDVIYMRMKNDISFLMDFSLNLFEHQSSKNPNMPLRGLMYFSRNYEKYIAKNELNIYSNSQIKIPTPKYIVFYNGEKEQEDKIIKLSDAFINKKTNGCIEVEARIININYGKNIELMDACKPLKDYSSLIYKIREYNKEMSEEEAIDKAVNYCIKNNILEDVLINHKAEVMDLLLTEFDEEKFIKSYEKEKEDIYRIVEQERKEKEKERKEKEQERKEKEKERKEKEQEKRKRYQILVEQFCKKIEKGKDVQLIHDELEIDRDICFRIYEIVKENLYEEDISKIVDKVISERILD